MAKSKFAGGSQPPKTINGGSTFYAQDTAIGQSMESPTDLAVYLLSQISMEPSSNPQSLNTRDRIIKSALSMIYEGANVNQKDLLGNTALMYAAQLGYTDVAEALINKGAKLTEKNSAGKTARDLAESGGHTDIVNAIDHAEKATRNSIPAAPPRPAKNGCPTP